MPELTVVDPVVYVHLGPLRVQSTGMFYRYNPGKSYMSVVRPSWQLLWSHQVVVCLNWNGTRHCQDCPNVDGCQD